MAIAGLPAELLRSRVVGGLDRAAAYGKRERAALVAFVVLRFTVAPGFDAHPRIRAYLTDPRMPPDARILEGFARRGT